MRSFKLQEVSNRDINNTILNLECNVLQNIG